MAPKIFCSLHEWTSEDFMFIGISKLDDDALESWHQRFSVHWNKYVRRWHAILPDMQTSESFVCCKKCLPWARTNILCSRHNFTKHNLPTQRVHNPPQHKHPWHGQKLKHQNPNPPRKNYRYTIISTPFLQSSVVTTATGENHQVATGEKNHRPHLPKWPLWNKLVPRRGHLAVIRKQARTTRYALFL